MVGSVGNGSADNNSNVNFGRYENWVLGNGGNVGFGRVGVVGNVALGSVGIVSNGGNVAFGRENCRQRHCSGWSSWCAQKVMSC